MQHAGQDDRRHFSKTQRSTPDNLPCALERQKRYGQKLSPIDVIGDGIQASIHHTSLYDASRHEDDECLNEERGRYRRAAKGREKAGKGTEDEAAETEECDGD